MSKDKATDLLVIGAGPGGYPAAFHAADLGLRVTLVDPEPNPGGVCLYRGCVPSKALLHVVSFLHDVEQASEWGVRLGKPEVDLRRLASWKHSVVERLTKGLGQLGKQRRIRYVRGTARLRDAHHAVLELAGGEHTDIAFEQAVVATGSVAASIPGMPDSPRIMTSRQALDLADRPERLLVIGGGYIGLELGQVYAALGSRVTVVEMQPEILPGMDRDLVHILRKRLAKQFASIRTGTKVKEMKEVADGLRVSLEGEGESQATFDKVMVAVGRQPCAVGVGLEDVNVERNDQGFIEVDAQRRTSAPSIFAVGDVAGAPMLAHKATHEGRVAAEAAAGQRVAFAPRAIPFVVFSDPEIAWCGLSEEAAAASGRAIRVTRFPWGASGRAVTLDRPDGLTKMLCDAETGRILGVGMVGRGAGELLGEATLAIEMGAVADDVGLTIHTHPTLSETLMEAAQAFGQHSTHISGR
ncbi:MAG: dihydrolipoyl dehydrogenase [Candidatus Marinimicrobia bacterium]|nr:dihydrolipoyl dehydrogenase [Candidatus Neomarinimicrobiota bacterium]